MIESGFNFELKDIDQINAAIANKWPDFALIEEHADEYEEFDDPKLGNLYHIFQVGAMLEGYCRITQAVAGLNQRGNLLDLGCWAGFLCSYLGREFPEIEVVGIDRAEKMIEALSNNSKQLPDNVGFVAGDFVEVDFELSLIHI